MLAAVALVVTACGSGGGAKTSNESLTVASFNFGESEILANM